MNVDILKEVMQFLAGNENTLHQKVREHLSNLTCPSTVLTADGESWICCQIKGLKPRLKLQNERQEIWVLITCDKYEIAFRFVLENKSETLPDMSSE